MLTINTQAEFDALVVNNTFTVEDDVTFTCDIKTTANISALDINALDINAYNINARDINFYAVCFAYKTLKCYSIKGQRNNSKYFCLDSEAIITNPN